MGWKVTCVMDEKTKFIGDYLTGRWTMAELCRRYSISRKTGYKYVARYKREGVAGLADRSRAPLSHPQAIDSEIEQVVLGSRAEHPRWGPRKLLVWLKRKRPELAARLPHASTVARLLKRRGMVAGRVKRARTTPSALPLSAIDGPNRVWSVDFKGKFKTQDGRWIYPLTITDNYSRFILRCQVMVGRTGYERVRAMFEAVFREYGLPEAIRSDNGPPFGTVGLGGLSRLAVWFMGLEIRPERIRPGKPQDNGRHERMHRTLKAETARPPRANPRAQQKAFDQFRTEFNEERPHEAIDQRTPSELYGCSERRYTGRQPKRAKYPVHWAVRKIKNSGRMKWRGRAIPVTNSLVGQYIGLEPIGPELWKIYYRDLALGIFEERRSQITPMSKWKAKPRPSTNEFIASSSQNDEKKKTGGQADRLALRSGCSGPAAGARVALPQSSILPGEESIQASLISNVKGVNPKR